MVGHCFAREFSEGGGGYVATGRGLSVEHIPFYKLYTMMAIPGYYPAVELIFFLLTILLLPGSGGEARISLFGLVFAAIYPVSLLFGPSWFNPHAFEDPDPQLRQRCQWWRCRQVRKDFKLWYEWLTSTLPHSGDPSLTLDQLSKPLAFDRSDIGKAISIEGDAVRITTPETPTEGGQAATTSMRVRKVNWGVVLPDLWPEKCDAAAASAAAMDPLLGRGAASAAGGVAALPTSRAREKKYTKKTAANPKYAYHPASLTGTITDVDERFKGRVEVKPAPVEGQDAFAQGQGNVEFENPWNGMMGKLDAYQETNSWREFHATKQQSKAGVEVRHSGHE